MEPEVLIAAIATLAASGGVAQTVFSILGEYLKKRKRRKVKISRDGDQVEVDLDRPDHARIYIGEYISRSQAPHSGRDE